MTHRERLERRAELRAEWADKAAGRAADRAATADSIAERFAGGQPILVGHHSEGKARRDQARMHANMSKSAEEATLAERHAGKAAHIEHVLATAIFSDDLDAVAALQSRIDQREAKAAAMVALNKAWRQSKGDPVAFAALSGIGDCLARDIAQRIEGAYSWEKQPYPGYELALIRAAIRKDKLRQQSIRGKEVANVHE